MAPTDNHPFRAQWRVQKKLQNSFPDRPEEDPPDNLCPPSSHLLFFLYAN